MVHNAIFLGEDLPDTQAAIVYKAICEDKKAIRATVKKASKMAKNDIKKTVLILLGGFLGGSHIQPIFATKFREVKA